MKQISMSHQQDDRGFILPMLGLLLIPLVVFTAIGVDVSSWYSRATELQRTADAAALAGVVWTPEIDKARDEATPVLARNGVVNGSNGMTVTMEYGQEGNTSFKVCVTDTEVTQFFGAVFASPTELTRCSTAQYNAPLQLGSPLNYFGGNSSANFGTKSVSTTNNGPHSTPRSTSNPATPDNYNTTQAPFRPGYSYGCRYRFSGTGSNMRGFWWTTDGVRHGGTRTSMTNNAARIVQLGGTWYYAKDLPDCVWTYPITTNQQVSANPIPPEKSPNFWAAIESYNYGHANGDAYSNAGAEYRDTGYWYSVDVPDSGVAGGTISIQAFDLGFNGSSRSATGDASSNSYSVVRMKVYKAGALKYDMSDLSEFTTCNTGWITGQNNTAYNNSWKQICAISDAEPGNRYYIQVQTTEGSFGRSGTAGVTGYAVRAVSGTIPSACLGSLPDANVDCYGASGDVQPRLSAYGDMEMYNGINSGQPTQFFLADVLPTYAGKTLVVDLFDPGDGASTSWVSIRGPSTTTTEGTPVPAGDCEIEWRQYGSSTWHTAPLSNGPSTTTIYNNTCTVQTSGGSQAGCSSATNKYNDCWLRFKIDLPTNYGPSGDEAWTKCNSTVSDPVVNPGSCWWQISYFVGSGTLGDYTTWSARVIGDPVRLTH